MNKTKMRILIFSFLFVVCNLHAQDYYASYLVDVPFGQEVQAGTYSVLFDEVISESRCPENVNCVRAGEAVIGVKVFEEGKLIYSKKLVFNAEGVISDIDNMIYSNDDIRLMGVKLSPYPRGGDKIPDEAYVMELKVN